MIVFVCGPSGSGKTSTIERSHLTDLGIETIRASQVLVELGRPISRKHGEPERTIRVALQAFMPHQKIAAGRSPVNSHD